MVAVKSELTETQVRGGRIFRNFSFLTAGKLVGDGSTFLLIVVLSRVFGQEGIGWYAFAMAFTGFFVVLADFGLTPFSIKELSRLLRLDPLANSGAGNLSSSYRDVVWYFLFHQLNGYDQGTS